MEHRPNIPGSQLPGGSNIPRRRSHSQPGPPPAAAGPSYRAADPFDFSYLSPLPAQDSEFPYDEDLFRTFMSMSNEQQEHHQQPLGFPPYPPPPAPPMPEQLPNQAGVNPLVTQAFLAWLQYVHLQNQLAQNQPQSQQQQQQQHVPQQPPQHQQPIQFPFSLQTQGNIAPPHPPPDVYQTAPRPTPQAGPSGPSRTRAVSVSAASSPASPEGVELTEAEQIVIAEDKRRRNTAASARFRVKKKQWTLNLERSISDLSGRVEELEREAAELRRENGWLKEIVMLKSKRFGGTAPELDPTSSQPGSGSGPSSTEGSSTSVDKGAENEKEGGPADGSNTSGKDKGKGRALP
ncbi:unnamed protein product [Somion occarium]|uniref:BZIP domain-containing protein n=1 Tax=Somion occarium TaxID=3059160 RepID=A0ABP1CKN1_9APHY